MSDSEATPAPAPEPESSGAPETPPQSPQPAGQPRPRDADYASVVQIDRNEDVATICGRIEAAPTYAVVVHAPGGNRELSREIGIRRLKRHAEESGRTIAIATSSWALASRARTVRIPVARKPEHVRWDSGGRMVLRLGRASILIPPLGRYIQGLAVVLAVLAVVALAFTMGPSASIVAYPPTETVERTVLIVASPDFPSVNLESLQVPAQNVTNTRTVTLAVPATGTQTVGSEFAVVTVTIYNDGDEDITVPEGTRFSTSGPAPEFELQDEEEIPAGGQRAVAAYAVEPGTVGNIGPGTISGIVDSESDDLRAENLGNAGGGKDGPATAVSTADVITIRDLAENLAVVESIKRTLVEDRPHDAVFLDTAGVEVELGEPSPPPGTIADVVVMDVRVTVTALAVVSSVLDAVAASVLAEGQTGEFIPGSVSAVETGARQFDAETRMIETELLIRGEFARNLSRSDIEAAVSGKSKSGAVATLSERYGIDDVELDLTPGWAPRLPRFGFRLDVELRTRDGVPDDADEELADTAATPANASPTPGN